ncbi:hypothetical protein FACS1894163_09620 [Spirochaetia bacterium]|nr:hypothetical protein FACS1894163_09620 [Spirochaetia bacterium]
MAIKMKMRDLTIVYAGFALIFCAVLAGLAACQIEIEGLNLGTPAISVDTGPTTGRRYTGPAFISYYNPDAVVLDGAEPQTTATLNITLKADGKLDLPTGAVKSITLTDPSLGGDKEYLIGRTAPSAADIIVLNLAADGKLQFRPAVDGAIPIGSYAEFQLINTALAGAYRQEADLDLMGVQWEPVGGDHEPVMEEWETVWLEVTPFTGEYDGNNKSIRNIHIKPESAGKTYQGLFGYLDSGSEVKKLSILSGTIDTGYRGTSVGSIAGRNKGVIIECNNAGVNVTGGTYIGGIAGRNEGEITRCYTAAGVGVYGYGSHVGGIAGRNEGAIKECYNDGVEVKGTGKAGGVAGTVDAGGAIIACYNKAAVSGGDDVGGVAGHVTGTITAVYNTGAVSGNYSNAGGVIGNFLDGGEIKACYNTGTVSGTSSVKPGGVIGFLSLTGQIPGPGECGWDTNSIGEPVGDTDRDTNGTTFAFGFSGATNFPAVSNGEWGTGDGSGSGKYWKAGTTGGGQLPRLWFE